MTMWIVYRNPSDYPNKWVVRTHYVIGGQTKPSNQLFVGDILDDVRAAIPPGRVRLRPHPEDDPVIYEVWV